MYYVKPLEKYLSFYRMSQKHTTTSRETIPLIPKLVAFPRF
jgi:hypothetical protein